MYSLTNRASLHVHSLRCSRGRRTSLFAASLAIAYLFSVWNFKVTVTMVLADFLTGTRRRWLKAFKLFKRNDRKGARNRVSPVLVRSPSYSGTVDARADIDVQNFCSCRTSLPPLHLTSNESYENTSYYSSFNSSRHESLESYCDSHCDARSKSDSAYDSARSSPAHARVPVCYATVTYFNVNDSEDTSSIRTEYTLLDYEADAENCPEEDENAQNVINESLELVSTL